MDEVDLELWGKAVASTFFSSSFFSTVLEAYCVVHWLLPTLWILASYLAVKFQVRIHNIRHHALSYTSFTFSL